MDEPAAGLDPRARIELRDIILRLADVGKSLLISSHILTELAEMCSRVAIIETGKTFGGRLSRRHPERTPKRHPPGL